MVPLTKFAKYPKEKRLSYVRKYYDAVSKHKINNPTPIMGGLRTPLRQFASCVLVDIDDTKGSISHSNTAIFEYTTQRAGIGINVGRIRGINSKIRNGEVIHTGLIPFLKMFESTVRSCTQNGIRGGNATVHVPIWHQEIEDVIVLKNNKGSEDNRVRKVDYSIQLSKIFYERFISDGDITLFSPHNVPGLYDKFGLEGFDELYVKYENDQSIPKKKVRAQELFINLLKERAETGRIYIMNIDHCNSHSSYLEQISMSNLCQEITEPTNPLQHIDDDNDAEIATCILSAINVGKLNSLDELEELCDLVVRGLDALIDYQDYPVKAAENFTKRRRSLGIGFTGLAHYLAKLGFSYESQEAWDAVHRLTEAFQYYLLVASNNLAKEVGPCEYYDRTKYSKGILPIDTYKKELDAVSSVPLQYDWESLRADILAYGLRNSTISSQMPVESTSLTTNSTNGIEPPRDFLSVKKSKKGVLKQIVPQYQKLKNNYTLLWEMSNNRGYLNVVGVQQKFLDQGISANTRYVPENYPNNEVPISEIAGDVIYFYSIGGKNLYYHNTNDGKTSDTVNDNQEDLQKIVDDIINSGDDICESCSV
jgi:ribonucleoside-diphosphate reductase alpha chain